MEVDKYIDSTQPVFELEVVGCEQDMPKLQIEGSGMWVRGFYHIIF